MATKKKAKLTKPTKKSTLRITAKAASTKAAKVKVTKTKTKTNVVVPSSAPVEIKPKEQVTIAKAKGRPMLSWVGKRPLRAVTAFPAQLVERFTAPYADKMPLADSTIWMDWPQKYPQGGLLFHGDNKEVLAHLLADGFRGKVQLIYIDPPFDVGADFSMKIEL